MVDLSPYASMKPYAGESASWLGGDDATRVAAYRLYDAMYRNLPDTFKLKQRGTERAISLPNPRILVEATNRYLAKKWTYSLDPAKGTQSEQAVLGEALQQLFRREQLWAKFSTQKRWGLVRGDHVWHVVADPDKDAGRRISVLEVDPGAYFPISDPWDPDKIVGCHLAEPVDLPGGGVVVRRQTYRKVDGQITYEQGWYEPGAWDDRSGSETRPARAVPPGQHVVPEEYLDERITALPVYHVKNNRVPGEPFGVSEIAGFESLLGSINQAVSDADVALALEGLGVYWTNSSPPTDDDGNETEWRLGPGWVLEIDEGSEFGRIRGIDNVEPYLQHVSKMEASMRQAAGVPDIAIGSVDSATAESGVALALKMSPLLAKNWEKEQELLSVMDHLLYDLVTAWLPAFEGLTSSARAVSVVDDPMPTDRRATLDEVRTMLDAGIISADYARRCLSERLGYEFPADMAAGIVSETADLAQARAVDPFAARVAAELGQENPQ